MNTRHILGCCCKLYCITIFPLANLNKLFLAAVIILGLSISYYFLYQYNYNEAKDAMSLVMPDHMLAYAQQNEETEDPIKQAIQIAREEKNLRGNVSTQDAPSPILFNSIPEGDIPPFPMEGQIMIEILAGGAPDLGWHGNVAYKNGQNMLSFEGVWLDYILVNCGIGEPYSVSFQKTDAEGDLEVQIWYRDADYDKPGALGGQKILDEGKTEAAYGIVQGSVPLQTGQLVKRQSTSTHLIITSIYHSIKLLRCHVL